MGHSTSTTAPSEVGPGAAHARALPGYTLVELIIVVALIGVLAAIGISQLSGFSAIGQDRQAQATAVDVIGAEESLFSITGSFSASPQSLSGRLPQVSFLGPTTPSTGPQQASVALSPDGETVAVAVAGYGGDCWLLQRQFASTGAQAALYALEQAPAPSCTAASALPSALSAPSASTGTSWSAPYIVQSS